MHRVAGSCFPVNLTTKDDGDHDNCHRLLQQLPLLLVLLILLLFLGLLVVLYSTLRYSTLLGSALPPPPLPTALLLLLLTTISDLRINPLYTHYTATPKAAANTSDHQVAWSREHSAAVHGRVRCRGEARSDLPAFGGQREGGGEGGSSVGLFSSRPARSSNLNIPN